MKEKKKHEKDEPCENCKGIWFDKNCTVCSENRCMRCGKCGCPTSDGHWNDKSPDNDDDDYGSN
ncbi:MAG: hypothetical protein AABX59_02500 [Nanoarchaeota archaeon]